MELGEWLCQELVKAVPHRHVVLSIPKILRRYFLYDRSLLSDLNRCGWEALKAFYTTGVRDSKAGSGAVVAIQTFGDFPLGFHPHLHILVSDPRRICLWLDFFKGRFQSDNPPQADQVIIRAGAR